MLINPPFSPPVLCQNNQQEQRVMAAFTTQRSVDDEQPRRRRIGRPPSKILKVTVSVRIPVELDLFLNEYSEKHDVLKGDVVTDALTLFRLAITSDRVCQAHADSGA
jgi:hypothetical protein